MIDMGHMPHDDGDMHGEMRLRYLFLLAWRNIQLSLIFRIQS
jgi:hypothetical protein